MKFQKDGKKLITLMLFYIKTNLDPNWDGIILLEPILDHLMDLVMNIVIEILMIDNLVIDWFAEIPYNKKKNHKKKKMIAMTFWLNPLQLIPLKLKVKKMTVLKFLLIKKKTNKKKLSKNKKLNKRNQKKWKKKI